MAIKISVTESTPALIYDRFFMESINMDQKADSDNSKQPYYSLKIQYRIYAVDENNIRHFKSKVNILTIEDYLSLAIQKSQQGDMDLIQAASAIEQALATIIEDQTNLGIAEVI